jgi:hypothetical protein
MAKRFSTLILLLIYFGSPVVLAQKKIPNDPYYKYQFSFHNPGGKIRINRWSNKPSMEEFDAVKGIDLNIEKAWAITTGSKSVVVALMDDGFFYDHPDLRDNIWHNPGETGKDADGFDKEVNGVDDDHNGYADDVMGWTLRLIARTWIVTSSTGWIETELRHTRTRWMPWASSEPRATTALV